MQSKARGNNAVIATRDQHIDPRWGGLDPEENTGKVKLMWHPAYGQRYFRDEDVENREGRGWEVVAYCDPTTPVSAPPPGTVIRSEAPKKRDEVTEATPTKTPSPRTRRRR